jgi:NAD(P)-dependent dehydrogenase (short-subunit alcohol dehydrogenase family)
VRNGAGSRLGGKVALITGAGSGIGRAAALRFAAEGAAVAVLDVAAEAAAETAELIAKEDGRALALAADVANAVQVEEAVGRAASEFGRIDVLYNNAGIVSPGSVEVAEEDDWDLAFDVNVKGTFLCSRAVLRHMPCDVGGSAGGGSIINQGSVSALVGVPNLAAYCATKGAVVALTRSMAVDLASRGVRVNVICPGTVYTPLMEPMLHARGDGDRAAGLAKTVAKYPLGRLGTPDEIANVALFLASDEASFMTGSVLTPDGGMTAQ